MGYQGEAPESLSGGGGFINEPGTYHFLITEGHDDLGKKGKNGQRSPISGCTLELVCLGGTADDCEGKTHSESIWYPSSQGSESANKVKLRALAALLIATNKMQPSDLGGSMNIDQPVLDSMRDCQIVMKLRQQMEKDGEGKYTVPTKFVELDYANIFHVDDPEVKAVPKNAEAMKLIPKEHRHNEAWFAFKKSSHVDQQPVAAAAATTFDDIV